MVEYCPCTTSIYDQYIYILTHSLTHHFETVPNSNTLQMTSEMWLLTHYQTTNFGLFKLEEFADDNFKFDENGRKLSKRVENTVGKGEVAHYEQFFLFTRCFQKACFPGMSKGVIVWEWVKGF